MADAEVQKHPMGAKAGFRGGEREAWGLIQVPDAGVANAKCLAGTWEWGSE